MKTTISLLALCGTLACGGVEPGVVAVYEWGKVAGAGQLLGGSVVAVDGRSAVQISNTNALPLKVLLLKIDSPAITKMTYAIQGEVRYENVEGDGYLEMSNDFPANQKGEPNGPYFSRTLARSGELARMVDSSGWRAFALPFDRHGVASPPTRLTVSLCLPGRGTVYVGPIKLLEMRDGWAGAGVPRDGWWSERAAGIAGGVSGSVLGVLAGLLAWLASRARARSFVLTTMTTLIVVGAALAASSVVALLRHQPYAVWFPLFLGGALLLGLFPMRLRQFRKQYQAMELRRMESVEASGR